MSKQYEKCNLCARSCGVNRYLSKGACGMTSQMKIARAALHHWEEPIISGTRGSGTIFFSGCSLSCVFCQNHDISRGQVGVDVDVQKLAEIMLNLQEQGAHNINLVTPTHFTPSIASSVRLAKENGLSLPIVYNTGSYDTVENLKSLEGIVDVYLPDLKYSLPNTAQKYSSATNYPSVARDAIAEMVRQIGEPIIDEEGIIQRGVIVRILLLPGHVAEAKLSLKYLYDLYCDKIYVSLMNQYTPMPSMQPPLNRGVTRAEYAQLTDYAEKLGVKNGFTQEFGTASESFIPPFDLTGVK